MRFAMPYVTVVAFSIVGAACSSSSGTPDDGGSNPTREGGPGTGGSSSGGSVGSGNSGSSGSGSSSGSSGDSGGSGTGGASGNGGSSGSSAGSSGGLAMSLNVQSQIATGSAPTTNTVFAGYYETAILLTNVASACTLVTNAVATQVNPHTPSNQEMQLLLLTESALAPGTYPVVLNAATALDGGADGAMESVAQAVYAADDQSCNAATVESGTSGTVTITSVSPNLVGSYDITLGVSDPQTGLPTGATDHASASFSATVCPAFLTYLNTHFDEDAGAACQ
jgi:hypothetical protein